MKLTIEKNHRADTPESLQQWRQNYNKIREQRSKSQHKVVYPNNFIRQTVISSGERLYSEQ